MTDPRRRYSDEEVALILRKAAQLDASASPSDAADGLSLVEIERIAREVGIAPDLVSRAAALLATDTPGTAARILGGPTDIHAEHTAAGSLPHEAFGDIVAAIRQVLGKPGKAAEVLDGLEWKSVGEATQITVIVRPSGGRTRVQILADRGGAALLTYLLTGAGSLLGGAITGSIVDPAVGHGLLIMGTAAGIGFLSARTIWAAATRRFRRTFQHLVNAVTSEVDRRLLAPDERSGS